MPVGSELSYFAALGPEQAARCIRLRDTYLSQFWSVMSGDNRIQDAKGPHSKFQVYRCLVAEVYCVAIVEERSTHVAFEGLVIIFLHEMLIALNLAR